MIIDADGHTHVPSEVFDEYLDPAYRAKRPRYVELDDGRGAYIIEGRVIIKPSGWGPGTPLSIGSRRLEGCQDFGLNNIAGRLADLDREGIDVQVIYPNVLMSINSFDHADLASAVARAYNKWMAERCADSGGRLKYAAVVALQDPLAAADEVEFAVTKLGAVGVMVPGTIGNRTLDHPDLYPFWERVQKLEVGVGVHTVTGMYPTVGADLFDHFFGSKAVAMPLTLTVALVSLIAGGTADLFPKLRFGLLETGCGWLPYWLERLDDLHERGEREPMIYDGVLRRKQLVAQRTRPSDLFTTGRMIVSCEPGERALPYVVSSIGDQCIMYASDYPHPDSKWPHTVAPIQAADMPAAAKSRILGENAARLYKLGE
jgi:predicted TIM-barrel fold metal-dependent hydrolase